MRDFFQPGRSAIAATQAAIATSHPLATAAGLAVLREGGNAVDAALAAIAVQCVVEPHMTGIGGDCYVLYAPNGGDVVALNGSGRSCAAASADRLRHAGLTEISQTSAHAVTIPGAVSAWTKLHGDHGSLALDRLFSAAIGYAENGYPVTARVASDWKAAEASLADDVGTAGTFLVDGHTPQAGQRHSQPRLADRLKEIARDGAAAFYLGKTARSMARCLRERGGVHTEEDFAEGLHGAEYVTPISTEYRGYQVLECPPNGQGIAALMILNILEGFELPPGMAPADRTHLHAEATKLAYRHRDALIADPGCLAYPAHTLLDAKTTSTLRRRVSMNTARPGTLWDEPEHEDTVYVSVVDAAGNAVSFINSLFHGFGSKILDPETGILLHSRGSSFRLVEGHPNELAPRKRPMHTIIPGMLRKNGLTVMPFGVMGGHYQAAGQAALLSGILDRRLDLQAAIDAPRAFSFNDLLEVEPTFDTSTIERLQKLGHRVRIAERPLGGAQAIWIDHRAGLLWGASDPRKDGCALGF